MIARMAQGEDMQFQRSACRNDSALIFVAYDLDRAEEIVYRKDGSVV